MNEKICKTIVEHREQFVPHLFTERQVDIMQKWLNKEAFTKTEQTYLYASISKKVDALSMFGEEWHITGDHMIPGRVEEAKKILKGLNKPAFISGTFLFSKEYTDIDIFIISPKKKSYFIENKHFIHLLERDLAKPVFLCAYKHSIANFEYKKIRPVIKRPAFNDIIVTYELAVNEILNKEDQKTVRELVAEYYLHLKGNLLNSYVLYAKTQKIISMNTKRKIGLLNMMLKKLLLRLYSAKYLYTRLGVFLKTLKEDISTIQPNDNLIIFHTVLSEVKNECRRAQA